mgnify:CR=1 FL=1
MGTNPPRLPLVSEPSLSGDESPLLPDNVEGVRIENFSDHPYRNLFRLLGLRPLRAIEIILVYIIKHSPFLAFPLYVEHVLSVLSDPSPQSFWHLLWPTIGMIALQFLNIPGHTLFIHMISANIRDLEKKLRSLLVRRLQYLSISFHHRTQSGELQAKVLRDVEQVEAMVRMLARGSFGIVLALVFSVVVTLFKEPLMLLFYMVAIPMAVMIMVFFKNILKERNRKFRKEMEVMSSSVSEMIDMIPVSKAHGLEQHEIRRVEGNLEKIHERGQQLDRVNAIFESSTFVTFQVTQLVCLVFTGALCAYGKIGVPELVLYQTLFGIIIQAVNQILNTMPIFSKGMASLQGLAEILDEKDLDLNQDKKKLKRVDGHIEFENVGYSYGEDWAVRNLSFRVWPGDCTAFVGESGSGKSTIMNMVIGFFRPQEGRIILDGVEQKDLDLQDYRTRVAVVPQNVLLFSGSLRENICYGVSQVEENHFEEVVRAAHLESFIEGLPQGLDTPIGENGVRLSGGQRQRIAIARALIRDPQVIILDEATSALDVISEKEVQLAIDELVKGRTTFIVAHRLSTIRQANRVVVMKGGHAVEMGSQEELMALEGEFSRLKQLQ